MRIQVPVVAAVELEFVGIDYCADVAVVVLGSWGRWNHDYSVVDAVDKKDPVVHTAGVTVVAETAPSVDTVGGTDAEIVVVETVAADAASMRKE